MYLPLQTDLAKVRTFSVASNRKLTPIGLNKKECLLTLGRGESPCLKGCQQESNFVCFLPFHPLCLLLSQVGLNDAEAIPDSFSLIFYLLSIPVERALLIPAIPPKIPGLRFFVYDWCSLGHMPIPEPIPVARTTLYSY